MPPLKRPSAEIDAIVRALDGPRERVAHALCQEIRALGPHLQESVKWGAPNWSGAGRVFNLMVYDDHVNLGLWRGAELAPRFPRIEGTGKSLRHVKFQNARQVATPEVREILRAAIALDML